MFDVIGLLIFHIDYTSPVSFFGLIYTMTLYYGNIEYILWSYTMRVIMGTVIRKIVKKKNT